MFSPYLLSMHFSLLSVSQRFPIYYFLSTVITYKSSVNINTQQIPFLASSSTMMNCSKLDSKPSCTHTPVPNSSNVPDDVFTCYFIPTYRAINAATILSGIVALSPSSPLCHFPLLTPCCSSFHFRLFNRQILMETGKRYTGKLW